MRLLQRAGFGFVIQLIVPGTDAADMLRTFRAAALAATWGVTVLASLGIMAYTRSGAGTVVTVILLELAGFAIGVLSLRRHAK